jgi:Na+/melibiose symporter-like transporter
VTIVAAAGEASSVNQRESQPLTASFNLSGAWAYSAPVTGIMFFYIPMWSILPGVYAKYFGLSLTTLAASVLLIRMFDGLTDTAVGYLSDWHRDRGGSRCSWVVVGSLGSIVACYFLFLPPHPVSLAHFIIWWMVYFLFFAIAIIPLTTWGTELATDYEGRARVFAIYNVLHKFGIAAFYALPLLPRYHTTEYTPQVLKDAVLIGTVLTVLGLTWALLGAPSGTFTRNNHKDSARSLIQSLIYNRPLLLFLAAFGCGGICYGMWFGLLFLYLDTYLAIGSKLPMMLLVATVIAALSTPLWLYCIRKTDKSTTWALAVLLFVVQLIIAWVARPASGWLLPFLLIVIAQLCFSCHDTVTWSMLGDIIDFGKLKFSRDRGATYSAFYTLIFKVGLGIGGGLSIGIAGILGFSPTRGVNDTGALFGLKLGFIILPACLALLSLPFILATPINRRRHVIIRRRLEARHFV